VILLSLWHSLAPPRASQKELLACREFSRAHEFEIPSVKEQPAGLVYTAQMINMAWRTGLAPKATENVSAIFCDVMPRAYLPVAMAA
jgi:hypothetical protein